MLVATLGRLFVTLRDRRGLGRDFCPDVKNRRPLCPVVPWAGPSPLRPLGGPGYKECGSGRPQFRITCAGRSSGGLGGGVGTDRVGGCPEFTCYGLRRFRGTSFRSTLTGRPGVARPPVFHGVPSVRSGRYRGPTEWNRFGVFFLTGPTQSSNPTLKW